MRDVVKVYATAAGEFTALKGINMQVGRGEFVGIIGKSGAGKSTLLNMITGVDDLTSGEVIVTQTVHRFPSINGVKIKLPCGVGKHSAWSSSLFNCCPCSH